VGNVLLGRFFGLALTTPSLLVPGLISAAALAVLALLVLPRMRRQVGRRLLSTKGMKASSDSEEPAMEDTEELGA
jgi:hypothetical protein